MFMSVVAHPSTVSVYPELAGARVLITGLTSDYGVDIARAFADHKARLVVQSPESSPELTEIAALLAENAVGVRLFNDPFASADDAVRLAQGAAQELGGLDAVVNIIGLEPGGIERGASLADVENFVSARLLTSALLTRVAANRMRVTWTEGTILNVIAMTAPPRDYIGALVDVMQATLSAMTRGEAMEWAGYGIRINAALPCGQSRGLASSADLAALALYLASKKGKGLTGHIFDADGIVEHCA